MSLTKVKAGNILLTTPSASSNDVTPATTQYVTTALANMVDSAPSTLNTLNELAAALGDDANFSTTVTNSIAAKLPLAGGTLTGDTSITKSGNPVFMVKTTGAGNNPVLRLQADTNKWDLQGTFSNTNDELFFMYNSSTKLVINKDGKVGIGQPDPATTLHIGDGASHYVRIENAGSGDVSSGYQIYRGSSVGMSLYDNPADNMTSLLCAGGLNVNAGGSGADLHVASNGNVGIGTTNTFAKLHVGDTGWSSGSPYGTIAYIEGGATNDLNWGHLVVSQSGTTTDTGGRISLGANGQNPIAGLRAKYKGATYGDLAFLTRPSGGTNTERMLIKANGGIQQQDPTSTSNRKEEVFHYKNVGTSYTDYFSVDLPSAHTAVFYEIITFGADWSSHSAARSYYKGFMSGTTGYSGDNEIENSGAYGAGSHIDWNYTRSGSTVTFQVKVYTGTTGLAAYMRVIGTFGNITLL